MAEPNLVPMQAFQTSTQPPPAVSFASFGSNPLQSADASGSSALFPHDSHSPSGMSPAHGQQPPAMNRPPGFPHAAPVFAPSEHQQQQPSGFAPHVGLHQPRPPPGPYPFGPQPSYGGYNPQMAYGGPQVYSTEQNDPGPTVPLLHGNNADSTSPPGGALPGSVVFLGGQYPDDFKPALIVFIIGWFCCLVWLAGFKFIKSPNSGARLLGILSLALFFVGVLAVILSISIPIAVFHAAASAAPPSPPPAPPLPPPPPPTSCFQPSAANCPATTPSASNLVVVNACGVPGGQYYVPAGTRYVSVSARGTWRTAASSPCVPSDGEANQCPVQTCLVTGGPLMALVAKCGTNGRWSVVSSGGVGSIACSGQYLYLAANDDMNNVHDNSGALSVQLTMN